MISGSTRFAAIFLLVVASCTGEDWGDQPGGKELLKKYVDYHEFIKTNCDCVNIADCDGFAKCIESRNCDAWLVDYAKAKRDVNCDEQKNKFIDCGVSYDILRMLMKTMQSEGKPTPTCLEPFQDNWKCEDVRRNNECLKELLDPVGCGKIIEPLQNEVCSGKSMLQALYSRNLAKYANQHL